MLNNLDSELKSYGAETSLSLGYLTGSKKILKNNWIYPDEFEPRKRRSIVGMFFKPFESKQEVIHCTWKVFFSTLNIAISLFCPLIHYIYTGIILTGALLSFIGASLLNGRTEEDRQLKNNLKFIAKASVVKIFQYMLDMIVLPLTLLIMTTRTLSTGAHAIVGLFSKKEESAVHMENKNSILCQTPS